MAAVAPTVAVEADHMAAAAIIDSARFPRKPALRLEAGFFLC